MSGGVVGQADSVREGQERLDALVAVVLDWKLDDLPGRVRTTAAQLILDTLGVILGGSQAPEVAELARSVDAGSADRSSGVERVTVVGRRERTSPLSAAFVNGISATWLDFDSGHRAPPGTPLLAAPHPPVHLVPTLLASGEASGATGSRMLEAMVAGYEVAGRIGQATRLRAEIHPHGTYPVVGAAVAAAMLAGMSHRALEIARLATGLTLMPSFASAYQGRTIRNSFAGVGASTALLAVELARARIVPSRAPIEEVFGSVSSPELVPSQLTDELGDRFEIELGYFKPFPACRFSHPAIEAAQLLSRQGLVRAEQVDEIVVDTYDLAATLDERRPTSELGAKFSIPFGVASMLVLGTADPGDYRTLGSNDPDVLAVADRVTVREDPAFTAVAPEDRPARIRLVLRDGTLRSAERERSSGGPDDPWDATRVAEKFRSLADPVLGSVRAERVVDMVLNLEELDDVRSLGGELSPR